MSNCNHCGFTPCISVFLGDCRRQRKLTERLAKLEHVLEAATELLQEELNETDYGRVTEWGPELESNLEWGTDCSAFKLGRAIREAEEAK